MNIIISARKTTVRENFKERAEKKFAKIGKFFGEDTTVNITVTNESDRETVEVTINSKGLLFRAEETTDDRIKSLDLVVDSLNRQIRKNKDKLQKKLKEFPVEYFDVNDSDGEQEDYSVVRSKSFPIKPMNVEEAILQMNMLGHSFFMFRNDVTEEINVVYKRKNSSYGIIEPELY